jgi:hypothetical protein
MRILYATGTSRTYFSTITGYTLPSWKYLIGDKIVYLDEDFKIPSFKTRSIMFEKWKKPSLFSASEEKFYRKSRCIVQALEDGWKYDYVIWIDGDVEVIKQPNLLEILPNSNELVSAVRKPGKDGTGLDSGFVAFNMKHKSLGVFLSEYTSFWLDKERLRALPYRYDAPVLEEILKKYTWRNLLNDDYDGDNPEKKHHCGFDGSVLEKYFLHYWGKKLKQQRFSNKKR